MSAARGVKSGGAGTGSVSKLPDFQMSRLRALNSVKERTDGPVIYWMSRDQRIADNWALVYARKRAAAAGVPLVIAFSLAPSFLGATIRHYGFMLRGLAETEAEAERLGIPFVLLVGSPHETIPAFAVAQGASLVVCDFSPLRMGVQWRKEIAAALGDSDKVAQLAAAAGVVTHATTTSSSSGAVPIAVHEVDAHNVVPVWEASDKLEYAARTIRPKVMTKLVAYLNDFPPVDPLPGSGASAWSLKHVEGVETLTVLAGGSAAGGASAGAASASSSLSSAAAAVSPSPAYRIRAPATDGSSSASAAGGHRYIELQHSGTGIDWLQLVARLPVDRTIGEVSWAQPGSAAGMAQLSKFLAGVRSYEDHRNNPTENAQSNLSPWLHYGQLAPQRAALNAMALRKAEPKHAKAIDGFIEELVVRRELADNFCFYNVDGYDDIDKMYPSFDNKHWAQVTLAEHARDKREFVYTLEQFETAKTHEGLWNAAQLELVHRGKLHGFMRMYWAKKILEWSASPKEALRICIYLNDRYNLDGRDPNGYVGCAWAIAGVHDNAWTERPVFGKIRYMNLAGCKSKFKVDTYIAQMKALASASGSRSAGTLAGFVTTAASSSAGASSSGAGGASAVAGKKRPASAMIAAGGAGTSGTASAAPPVPVASVPKALPDAAPAAPAIGANGKPILPLGWKAGAGGAAAPPPAKRSKLA